MKLLTSLYTRAPSSDLYLLNLSLLSIIYLSIYKKETVCTFVPLSLANCRTNLHQILPRPPHQLREGSFYKSDPETQPPSPGYLKLQNLSRPQEKKLCYGWYILCTNSITITELAFPCSPFMSYNERLSHVSMLKLGSYFVTFELAFCFFVYANSIYYICNQI